MKEYGAKKRDGEWFVVKFSSGGCLGPCTCKEQAEKIARTLCEKNPVKKLTKRITEKPILTKRITEKPILRLVK